MVKGRIFRVTGEREQAIAEFRAAIAAEPLNVTAHTSLALAYTDAGRPAEAEQTYLEAVRIRPSYWQAYSNLGVFYQQRGAGLSGPAAAASIPGG